MKVNYKNVKMKRSHVFSEIRPSFFILLSLFLPSSVDLSDWSLLIMTGTPAWYEAASPSWSLCHMEES